MPARTVRARGRDDIERRLGSGDLGHPSLTTPGVLGQALAIGPIFSAAFLSGTVAVFAGFNTPLSVLLAGLGMLGLAYREPSRGRRPASTLPSAGLP
jgi:amino acid transporter